MAPDRTVVLSQFRDQGSRDGRKLLLSDEVDYLKSNYRIINERR